MRRAWWLLVALGCRGEAPHSGEPVDSAPPTRLTDSGLPDPPPELSAMHLRLRPGLGTVPELSWVQLVDATTWLEFQHSGEAWRSSPRVERETGAHQELMLGLPYGVEVSARLQLETANGELISYEFTTETAERPPSLPRARLLQSDPARYEPTANYIVTSMNRKGDTRYGRWWVMILDRKGRVVWGRPTHEDYVSRYVRVSRDGRHLLVDFDSYWVQGNAGADSLVLRMQLDGQVSQRWATPGLHHAFTELPGDRIAWMALEGSYSNETLRVVDTAGQEEVVWNCREDWVDQHALPSSTCGTNGLFWHEATDRYLVSSWGMDTVAEVDAPTGSTTRWFGQIEDSWSFDPPDSEFDWQHGPIYTEEGHLMVSSRRYDETGEPETVVYEYELEEKSQTLREVWSFGKGEGIYGAYMGEVHRLPGGNTLHNYGEESRLREATPEGDVVWELWWHGDRHIGRSEPLEDLYDLAP